MTPTQIFLCRFQEHLHPLWYVNEKKKPIQLKYSLKNIMAHGGYDRLPDNDDDFDFPHQDDDDNADQTTPFFPNGASTPYQSHFREEMEMKEIHKKSDRPETSYAETSFGGTEDLEKRLAILRRDNITGLLNTTKIPDVEDPLTPEQRQNEIQRVRDFIKTRYPNADLSKLVVRFSSKKPMDIVVLGKRGGETKIIKDNGSDFQKSFLNLTYVKSALGESFEQILEKENQRIAEERRMLANLEKKSSENRTAIDDLKDKISKKETEKKAKEREFYRTKQTEEIKEREEEIKRQNEEDKKILNDENVFPQDKQAAEERIAQRNEELAGLQTLIQEREEAMPLREKIKEIFKKNGVTVTAIFRAAGGTIGAVIGTVTNALKKLGTDLGNGRKTLGAKAASALPGLIGAIVSFLFKAAGSAIGFLAEHTWLLILAVVAFLFQKLMKRH